MREKRDREEAVEFERSRVKGKLTSAQVELHSQRERERLRRQARDSLKAESTSVYGAVTLLLLQSLEGNLEGRAKSLRSLHSPPSSSSITPTTSQHSSIDTPYTSTSPHSTPTINSQRSTPHSTTAVTPLEPSLHSFQTPQTVRRWRRSSRRSRRVGVEGRRRKSHQSPLRIIQFSVGGALRHSAPSLSPRRGPQGRAATGQRCSPPPPLPLGVGQAKRPPLHHKQTKYCKFPPPVVESMVAKFFDEAS